MEPDPHEYEGGEIDVSYDANRCIHVRECVEGLPAVFDADRRPWVDPDGADPDAVAAVVERCPTGALHYERHDGPAEAVPERNAVSPTDRGPVYLHGDVRIETPDGEPLLEDTRVALCRCGHSGNKPLCDNSHARVFDADGAGADEAPEVPGAGSDPEADAESEGTDGRLTVVPTRNGPFALSGSFTLRGTDGEPARHESATLCRCGNSADKPFCDGTHAEIGFETEPGE
jgi:CDGSH-type Zn-finger protein/uncharacterized Fe-S cluster protein YjdI